ncbi:MAG TPA: hypothetical protein VMB18_11385 [Terriglobales bacterium]|nr:hypothetical protein [Terriglobales bacterium]
MKLQIDNLDGLGPRDYTSSIDASRLPQVIRKLNQPSELRVSLVADSANFVVPATGARIALGKANGQDVFTGYLIHAPEYEYLGWSEQGPVYRYNLIAQSDETLLNEKRLPDRSPFVERSAGNALRQLTEDLLPGVFDTSQVQDLDLLAGYASEPQKTWGEQAAEIAIQARARYYVLNGALIFSPVASIVYALDESDPNFNPQGLRLQPAGTLLNDVTVIGEIEPQAYVKDYFVGDGLTERFYLSQTPFKKENKTVFDEEYAVSPLEPTLWSVVDPKGVVSVSNGQLQIAGGTGVDGATTVEFVEQIELGGASVIEHGDFVFGEPSTGVLGGLYPHSVCIAGCLAGFSVTPSGTQSSIQALVNGTLTGTAITTTPGHHYLLTTRIYCQEMYRRQQIFHSSLHPAGSGIGAAEIAADVRIVLEVHDIDPTNPATEVAPATVLYDGVISGAPDFCTYALVNAANLQCSVAFTRLIQAVDTEVRSALPGLSYVTQIVGPLSEGSECNVTSSGELEFYSAYVPAANQQIEVRYRGQGRALARVTDPASIAAQQRGVDNGLHGGVRHIKEPLARTAADCENAALAIFDDMTNPAWSGQYECWSDFLPGSANDIFPGDALGLNLPSRGANFNVNVREVEVTVNDLEGENCRYKIGFANDAAESLAFEIDGTKVATLPWVTAIANTQVGSIYLADLTDAEVTEVTSTTLNIDVGIAPPAGGGFEVRWSDSGWGQGNERNLMGRFTTQTFTVPRLSRVQDCYLRQYDNSSPPKYSRYTTALHIDLPLDYSQ